tara:strand:- start:23152 stop:24519 length:1368 start_codon:yes stop_codon:yes gene_type:complete
MKKFLLIVLVIPQLAWSQIELSFKNYMEVVKLWHPISMQSQLLKSQGEAVYLGAKGSNDPQLTATNSQKNFGGKDYYNLQKYGLKIPTRSGVSFQGGYENNSGDYLNPMDFTTSEGQYYAGVQVKLGKGLFMDKRRAAIQQAELFASKTIQQQQVILNNLFLQAGNAYWDWLEAKNNLQVFENAITLAEQRYKAVLASVQIGERSSNDTLEAKIQLQTRMVQYQQSKLNYANTKALVQVYLWQDGTIPLAIEEGVYPNYSSTSQSVETDAALYIDTHPELGIKKIEIQSSQIDLQLKKEAFKPVLNLKYDLLSSNYSPETTFNAANNYRLGLQFSMPILLRTARGETKVARYKLDQKELQLTYKKAEILYKVSLAENELNAFLNIISVQNQSVKNYERLLKGERTLFDIGESSLFMVNSREMKFIDSQIKLNKFMNKMSKSQLKIKHAKGVLYLM